MTEVRDPQTDESIREAMQLIDLGHAEAEIAAYIGHDLPAHASRDEVRQFLAAAGEFGLLVAQPQSRTIELAGATADGHGESADVL